MILWGPINDFKTVRWPFKDTKSGLKGFPQEIPGICPWLKSPLCKMLASIACHFTQPYFFVNKQDYLTREILMIFYVFLVRGKDNETIRK